MKIVSVGKSKWYKAIQDEVGLLVYFGTEEQCEKHMIEKGW
jgi:hypothetical protein